MDSTHAFSPKKTRTSSSGQKQHHIHMTVDTPNVDPPLSPQAKKAGGMGYPFPLTMGAGVTLLPVANTGIWQMFIPP